MYRYSLLLLPFLNNLICQYFYSNCSITLQLLGSAHSYVIGEDVFKSLFKKVLELNQNVKILTAVVQQSLQQNKIAEEIPHCRKT